MPGQSEAWQEQATFARIPDCVARQIGSLCQVRFAKLRQLLENNIP